MVTSTRTLLLAGAGALALLPQIAAAQSQAAVPAPDAGSGIGDIVVTANKRPSTAQSTPIALNVFSAETLKSNGVGNIAQLANFAPTVNIGQSAGASIITIRGVSSRDVTEIGDPAVAVNVDGIYLQRPTGMNAGFYDIERVEVLRGPQGTLYGRNATGGAINIISQGPTNRNEGYATIEGGNYGTVNGEAAINVHVSDTLDMRASGVVRNNDGYRNNGNGLRGDDTINQGGRLQLRYRPTDRLTVNLGASYMHIGGTGSVFDTVPTATVNGVDVTRPPTAYGATNFALNTKGHLNVQDVMAHAQVDYDLGAATATYIGGYHRQNYNSSWDNDGSASKGYIYTRHELTADVSQELRFASNNKHGFLWQFGGFYFHEAFPLNNYFDLLSSSNVPVNVREYHYSVPTTSYAAFGQASYDLTGKLRVTGGLRYTHDSKARDGNSLVGSLTQNVNGGTAVRVPAIEASHVTSNKLTWHAGVDYQVTSSNLLYAKADSGYKAGGFNNFGYGTYAPETITAFELGSKNRFLDNALQVNLSAFYYNYKNQQVSQYVAAVASSITVNAGVSHMYGGELETTAKLSGADQLDASVAYLHAKYVDLAVANGTTNQSLDGNDVIQSPAWTLSAGYQHTFNAFGGTIVPRVQTQYRSAYYLTIYNRANDRQDAFTRTDLSLTFKPDNGRYSVQAYVRNLENSVVISNANQSALYGGVQYQYDAPRTYGARLTYNW